MSHHNRRARWAVYVFLLFICPWIGGCGEAADEPQAGVAAVGNGTPTELPTDEELRNTLDEVLDFTYDRVLRTDQHAAWQIMHGLLAYQRAFRVQHDGELVPALDWILGGGDLRGWTLRPTEHGLDAVLEAGSSAGQGHEDQWLAVLAQCDLPADAPIIYHGKDYTVSDIVEQTKWDVHEGMECSWTLIGLSAYLPLDAKWTAADGEEWSIERIMAMEAAQDLNESSCGGSHRLIGMTMTLNRYLAEREAAGKSAEPLTGGWLDASKKIEESIALIKQYRQADGSLSSSYLQRGTHAGDYALRINTTGHTLEFLVLALDDEELKSPWIKSAAVRLCEDFRRTRHMDLECGSLYHAAHALQLYRLRRFGQAEAADKQEKLAQPESAAGENKNADSSDGRVVR